MKTHSRMLAPAAALLIAAACGVHAAEGTLSVVIPAKAPSRPAHFNWQFTSANGQAPQTGQFACGSYWVAPAEGDQGVTFVALKGNPAWQDLLSCDADPVTERHGLLSGKNHYGSHEPSENVLPQLPITYKTAADSCISLVAAMQRNEAATSKGGTKQIVGEVVDAYCVVTVLPSVPKDGGRAMIRPNITGATKQFLTWEDFDLTRLPQHAFLSGKTTEELASAARRWSHCTEILGIAAEGMSRRQGLQFEKFSEGGRAFRSHLLIHDYASGMARQFNGDLLAMFSPANTIEEKKPALAAMLAFGLDIHHARYDIGTTARKRWSCGAGQSPGQYLPAVFAAALLRDPANARQLQRTAVTNQGTDPGELGPQELRQITRGLTGVLLWGDGQPIRRADHTTMVEQDWRYWADFVGSKCYDSYEGQGDPNRGQKTAADPYGYIDGPANKPGSSYMGVSLGPFRSFAAAMILMPEIRRIVNTDAPIEYVDRATRHGLWTWPDPVAAPAKVDQETARTWWSVEGCQEWGKTWGPRPDDVRFAVEDGKGRFKSLHGKPVGNGYETAAAENHWATILALYDGSRFEANVVELGTVVAPEILFTGGEHSQAHLLCATPEATIHYTLDGSPPTSASPAYAGTPLPVEPTTVVTAFAAKAGMTSSAVRSRVRSESLIK